MDGKCIAGKYEGSSLPKIEAYQEFGILGNFSTNALVMQ